MTFSTALDHLKKIYSDSDKDELSIPEIYNAAKLNPRTPTANRQWLANKLTYLKRYELVEAVYATKNHIQVLDGIKLTEQGKLSLKRPTDSHKTTVARLITEEQPATIPTKVISMKEVMDLLLVLGKSELKTKFRFDIKLNEGVVSIHMV